MPYLKMHFATVLLFVGLAFSLSASGEPESSNSTFMARAFNGQAASLPKTLWLNKDVKQQLKDSFDYELNALRIRYWLQGDTSAWILDEVGKEQPITMGIAVNAKGIKTIQVLEYRESRGGEIQYPFFTEQFNEAALSNDNNRLKLDRHIDGITGATLSVRAMIKVAQAALFLHQKVTVAPSDNE